MGRLLNQKLFKFWVLFWITCLVIWWTSFAKNRGILKGASLDSWYSLRIIFCIAVEEGKQHLYYSILYSYESVFTINLLYYVKGFSVILLNPWNSRLIRNITLKFFCFLLFISSCNFCGYSWLQPVVRRPCWVSKFACKKSQVPSGGNVYSCQLAIASQPAMQKKLPKKAKKQ